MTDANTRQRLAFDAVRAHEFSRTVCFLCGAPVDEAGCTREHVFPRWLLSEFDLWDVPVILLNGTAVPYRKLVIPCCNQCNSVHLGRIENAVKTAFDGGAEAIVALDRKILMAWTLKIFYGLLYREVFMTMDRADPSQGSIVTPENMERYQMLHFLLQSCRIPTTFSHIQGDIPASIFVFSLQQPSDNRSRFDFRDDILHNTLYLRMGHVGILAAFDAGAQAVEGREYFGQHQGRALHPIQFAELGAYMFAKARHLLRNPTVVFSESPKGLQFSVTSIAGAHLGSVFSEWSHEEIVGTLVSFLGYPREIVEPIPQRVATWLTDQNGLRDISLE